VKTKATSQETWDDVSGTFQLPYNVTDANGTANGVITLTFTPQPDITVTSMRGMKNENYSGTVKVMLNGTEHTVGVGTKIQGKTGANTWKLVKGQTGLMNYTGVQLDGEQYELPLNNNLEESVETLTNTDRTATITVFPNNYPEYSGACKADIDLTFPTIPADTHTVVQIKALTKPYVLGGNPLGNISMTVGGASYQLWQEAVDSIVAEDARAAALVGRAPIQFIFSDDSQQDAEWEPNSNGVGFRPKAGSLYFFDRNDLTGAATVHKYTNGAIASGTASSVAQTNIGNRQLEWAKWLDRHDNDAASSNNCTRATNFGPVLGTSRRPWESNLLPFLHLRADHGLSRAGKGWIDYR